jgi:hypothetical protein
LQLEGTKWDGRAAASAFEEDLAERVCALREERVSVYVCVLSIMHELVYRTCYLLCACFGRAICCVHVCIVFCVYAC